MDITVTFYDNTKGLNEPVNATWHITNHNVGNFELKCEPKRNLTSYLYESSALIDDIKLSLNMTEQLVLLFIIPKTQTWVRYFK